MQPGLHLWKLQPTAKKIVVEHKMDVLDLAALEEFIDINTPLQWNIYCKSGDFLGKSTFLIDFLL